MKKWFAIVPLLFVSLNAHATTTVTVDDNNKVQVNQAQSLSSEFEGEIEKIDRSTRMLDVIDTEGRTRQVFVREDAIDTYRTGDFVRIQPIEGAREVAFVREESDRDLEGRIVNVDNSQSTISVRDARGRDRRIKLKQGMISNYKVDDYVRIHLMADLKEAKMIRTIN